MRLKNHLGAGSAWKAGLFPFALWWLATFFFGGQWDKFLDDYSGSLRDPVTGAIDWSGRTHRKYFYRPLSLRLNAYLKTVLWDHFWVSHLLSALIHGLLAFGVWRLLRQLSLSRQASAVGALFFLVLPTNSLVVFWGTAVSIEIAAGLWLILALVFCGYARGQVQSRVAIPVITGLGFVIPCFYEQPSAGIIALPLLYFAVRPRNETIHRAFQRALGPTVLCGLMSLLYAYFLFSTAPATKRRGPGSLVSFDDVLPRLKEVLGMLNKFYAGVNMEHLVVGGFRNGWHALGSPLGAIALVGVAALGGLWLAIWWFKDPSANRQATLTPSATASRSWVWPILFGAVVFLGSWFPLLLIKNQLAETRLGYFPAMGIAIFLGATLDAFARISVHRRVQEMLKAVFGMLAVTLALLGAICCVGFQAAFRERSSADLQQVSRLRDLVPDPPPKSVFVPLSDHYRTAQTGLRLFDVGLSSWLCTYWSAPALLAHTYQRDDLFITARNMWSPLPLSDFGEKRLRYQFKIRSLESHPKGGTWIGWDRMLPFVVGGRGSITLVERLIVEKSNLKDLEIDFPLVNELPGVPTTTFVIPETSGPPAAHKVEGWSRDGQLWPTGMLEAWSVRRQDVLRLHPADSKSAQAITLSLAPNAGATTLYFRATLPEQEYRECSSCYGVTLVWSLTDSPELPLARLRLSRSEMGRERRWFPVRIDLPPRTESINLMIRVEPNFPSQWESFGAGVTVGWISQSSPNSSGGAASPP